MDKAVPVHGVDEHGIYPRCVWCNGENYLPAVINYSKGKTPCAAAGGCGKYLPKSYIKLDEPEELQNRHVHSFVLPVEWRIFRTLGIRSVSKLRCICGEETTR